MDDLALNLPDLIPDLVFKNLGQQDYAKTLLAMQNFTEERIALDRNLSKNIAQHAFQNKISDEIWFCEHPAVFTYGKFGDLSHILNAQNIPVIPTDRGGQVTYHGPGQLMIYTLINLKQRKIGVKAWVTQLEEWIIQLLKQFNLTGEREPGKPGIYINHRKICSLGLKIKNGCCYHGAALNIDMDLSPFTQINPCGYAGQPITDLVREIKEIKKSHKKLDLDLNPVSLDSVAQKLQALILNPQNSPFNI